MDSHDSVQFRITVSCFLFVAIIARLASFYLFLHSTSSSFSIIIPILIVAKKGWDGMNPHCCGHVVHVI